MPRVLVAVQNEKLGHFVARALREQAFEVEECWTGKDALRLVKHGDAYLIGAVVHAELGEPDGFAVIREARRRGARMPILMLGATDTVEERVRGFESGADDFLSKPFMVVELIARLRALVRRGVDHRVIVCGELTVDRLRGATLAGRELRCTTRELAVLAYLAEHQDHLVTRLELLAGVWGSSFDEGSNALDVHLSHLRAKLGSFAWIIETVRGKGYRLRSHRDH